MKKTISIILLALTVSATVNAQEFLDNLRDKQTGKGKVTVSQSKEIDDLLKAPSATSGQVPAKQQTQPQQNQQKGSAAPQKTATQPQQQKPAATQPQQPAPQTKKNQRVTPSYAQDNDEYATPTVDTRKKVMRKSYRMPGYRIQVYSGGNSRQDKQKAFNAGKVIKQNFPDQPVYAHFKSPSWKCRMGNFKSQYEAQRLLPLVKKLGFPQATVVKETIQVQY